MHRLDAGTGILFAVGGGALLVFVGVVAMQARRQRRRDLSRTRSTWYGGIANADDVLRRAPYMAIAAFLMLVAGIFVAVTARS